jgi:hypothetical protein
MSPTAAESLFHLAIAMRTAYPYRGPYDRGSALTVELAIAYGERLLRAQARNVPPVATGPAWQPGRDS